MLQQLESVKQKWGGKNQTIDNWLHARQSLLVSFCHLAGLNQRRNTLPEASEIEDFCEKLMDYISAGHFEVFDMLVNDNDEGVTLKQNLYPKLTKTTDAALQFNDKFAEAITMEQAALFEKELAELGETLEERFKLEDQLISHMYANRSSDDTKE